MGGSARSDGVRSRFQKASSCCAVRCTKSEPPRYNRLCPADQQCQMGRGSRKCAPLGTPHGVAKGFCCERLSNRDRGQGSLNGAGREAPAFKAGVSSLWNRRSAWKVVTYAVTRADPIRLPFATSRQKDWNALRAGQKRIILGCASHIVGAVRPEFLTCNFNQPIPSFYHPIRNFIVRLVFAFFVGRDFLWCKQETKSMPTCFDN